MLNKEIDNCKTSKLYDISKIQKYGVLIAVDVASGNIIACSENINDIFEFDSDQLLDKHYSKLLLCDEMNILINSSRKAQHKFWQTTINERQCFISAHSNSSIVIIEIEPSTGGFLSTSSDRIGFMHDIALIDDPEEASRFLMERIADLIGFDRVMLYKFLPGWHGVVVAEILNPNVQGFLNLHFPAGDIPEYARKLYERNLQRYIADTAVSTSRIVTTEIPTLDLTYSQLRAVHPVHIEYLKNIGARSSFSISILVAGQLWGMIACHHQMQKQLDFSQRFYCEELSRMTSLHISGLIAMSAGRRRFEVNIELAKAKIAIEQSGTPSIAIENNLEILMKAFNANSVLLQWEDKFSVTGAIKSATELSSLQTYLKTLEQDQIWQSNQVPDALEQSSELKKYASGLLYLPLDNDNYVALLRNELKENQQWAGKLPTLEQSTDNMLTPRASFEIWMQETNGTAQAWSDAEIQTATEFSDYLTSHLERFQLAHLAMQDHLTGLSNRRKFELDLHRVLSIAQKNHLSFAVYILDLDRFKHVNDTLGHHAGDELLTLVGSQLKRVVRENDTVARIGGDEFAIIQHNLGSNQDIEVIADRIIKDLGHAYSLQAGNANIGVSVGIAVYPGHAGSAKELIAHADTALYKVKEQGRNSWKIWAP